MYPSDSFVYLWAYCSSLHDAMLVRRQLTLQHEVWRMTTWWGHCCCWLWVKCGMETAERWWLVHRSDHMTAGITQFTTRRICHLLQSVFNWKVWEMILIKVTSVFDVRGPIGHCASPVALPRVPSPWPFCDVLGMPQVVLGLVFGITLHVVLL